MTNVEAARGTTEGAGAHEAAAETQARAEAERAQAAAEAAANPALLGVPTFVIGAVALGLYLIGFKGADNALAGMLPILLFSNGLGLLVAAVWAIRAGQGPVAAIFGIFDRGDRHRCAGCLPGRRPVPRG